jgi:hypothetical protein
VNDARHLVDFLAGAVALTYLVAGSWFLRFWRKTRDRLFLSFALAFWLLTLNQVLVSLLGENDERSGYAYVLRVAGFLLILLAIVDKNVSGRRGSAKQDSAG